MRTTHAPGSLPGGKMVDYKIVLVLSLVHFTGDFYSSFFTPLLPAFQAKLSLTLTQVGLITGTVRFLSFVVQPVVGYMADRYETRWFVLTGLFLVFFIIPFSGIAPNYWILLSTLCLGSFGSSMFHPSTSGMVNVYAGNRAGFAQSIFNTGGTLAFALGPVFITWYVSRFGLSAMPWTMLLGLVSYIFCLKYMPRPVSENMAGFGFINSLKHTFGKVYKTVFLIWLVMVLRAVVGQTFLTFMPIYLTHNGHPLPFVGVIIALFTIAGTLSGLTAGYCADRFGFTPVFFVSYLLMPPTLLMFLYMPGFGVYAGSFLAGFFVLAPMPLGVVMAQKLAPGSRAMAASLMMGLAYGLGGVISPGIGRLADIFGLTIVLKCTAFIPLACLVPIALFPKIK